MGIVGIAIAIIAAYIAYLQLKRTPPPKASEDPEELGDVKPQDDLEVVAVDVIANIKEIHNFRRVWFAETDLDIGGGSFSNADSIGSFPLIDFKLRNPSNSTVFLKRIDFNVQRLEAVPDPMKYSVWPVAWEYSVLLDPHKETDTKSLNLSQVIKPNDADRFVVVLGHTQRYGEFEYVTYNVQILLCYNDDSSINLGQHVLTVTSPANFDKRNAIGIRDFSAPRLHEGDSLSYNFDTVDVTIPHAAEIRGGQKFVKTWRVVNNGTSTWGPGYHLVYAGRDHELSGKPIPLSRDVRPTEEVDISVQFVAPSKAGSYVSSWQMADANGKAFRSSVSIVIIVKT